MSFKRIFRSEILNQSSPLNRIAVIDNMRGIAALGVCLFHSLNFGFNDYYLGHHNILGLLFLFGSYGVQMFFVISGFVIPYSMYKKNYEYRDIGRFLLRRTVRIDIPYFSLVIISVVAYSYFPFLDPSFSFNLTELGLHFIYLPTFFGFRWYSGVFWTLLIEMQFYLLISFLLPLILKTKSPFITIILILVQICGLISPDMRIITPHISFFVLGITGFLYTINKISLVTFWINIIISCFFNSYLQSPVANFFLYHVFGTLTGIISILMIVYFKWNHPVTLWLGKISYSLYLTHILILELGFNMAGMLEIENIFYRHLAFIILCIINIIVAWLFYLLIEQTALRLATKIKLRKLLPQSTVISNAA